MVARYTARGQALLEKLGNALPGLRPLAENDFPALLALYKSNPFYLSISQEGPPTLEDCQEDAAALPPGRGQSPGGRALSALPVPQLRVGHQVRGHPLPDAVVQAVVVGGGGPPAVHNRQIHSNSLLSRPFYVSRPLLVIPR